MRACYLQGKDTYDQIYVYYEKNCSIKIEDNGVNFSKSRKSSIGVKQISLSEVTMSRCLVVSLLVVMILGIYSIQDSTAGSECPENQQEHICGTLCEPTCSNPQPNRKFCPRIVCNRVTSGCRCVKDTVRDTNSSQCVPLDQCP